MDAICERSAAQHRWQLSTRDKEMIYEPGQSCDMAINEIIETSGEAIYHENREGQSA